MKHIAKFLRETYPCKSFVYYNNKSSFKIQIPTRLEQPLLEYLASNNITYKLDRPEYVQIKLFYYSYFTTISIKK
jgi:hypothetical protein